MLGYTLSILDCAKYFPFQNTFYLVDRPCSLLFSTPCLFVPIGCLANKNFAGLLRGNLATCRAHCIVPALSTL